MSELSNGDVIPSPARYFPRGGRVVSEKDVSFATALKRQRFQKAKVWPPWLHFDPQTKRCNIVREHPPTNGPPLHYIAYPLYSVYINGVTTVRIPSDGCH